MFTESIPRCGATQDGGKLGGMVVLFLLCGVLAGFAAYRFGAARASMRQLNTSKSAVGTVRKTAWRHSGVAVLLIGGVILLLFVAGRFGG
jgi:hypothetical protein